MYQVVKRRPKQGAFTLIKEYKTKRAAQDFIAKNPGLSLRQVVNYHQVGTGQTVQVVQENV